MRMADLNSRSDCAPAVASGAHVVPATTIRIGARAGVRDLIEDACDHTKHTSPETSTEVREAKSLRAADGSTECARRAGLPLAQTVHYGRRHRDRATFWRRCADESHADRLHAGD